MDTLIIIGISLYVTYKILSIFGKSTSYKKDYESITADFNIVYNNRNKYSASPTWKGYSTIYKKSLKKSNNKDYAFIVFDLETTGINSKYHKITEIGAIKVHKNSNEHQSFQALIKQSKKLPKKIVEMTGITDELLEKEGISEEVAIVEFLEFIGDLPLVAYNSSFDMRFLKKTAEKYGYMVENQVQCALTLARKKVKDVENHKLSTIAEHFGISSDGTHRALEDCKITLQVFDALNT